jgi:hypothetical protein
MSSDVLYRLDLEIVEESCFISEPHYSTALGAVASTRYLLAALRAQGKCRYATQAQNDCVLRRSLVCDEKLLQQQL